MCEAQDFALPVDVAQGLVFGADRPRTPYLFGASIAPSLDLGVVRASALIAPSYRNPKWDVGLGGRLSVYLPLAGDELGLRLAAQGQYLPRQRAVLLHAGLIAEAFGLVRLGLWPGYDLDSEHAELTLSLGTDVVAWIRMFAQDSDSEAQLRPRRSGLAQLGF